MLLKIPEEILVQILSYLDYRDLLRCMMVCRMFEATILETALLQYSIELQVAGLMDGDPSSSKIPLAERRAQLKSVEHNWDHLQFRTKKTIPKASTGLYELIGGMLAFGGREDHHHIRGLTFIDLPSAVRNTTDRVWKHIDLEIDIRDFTMDPVQDLLVLIEIPKRIGITSQRLSETKIHIRSLATGRNHALTSAPIIPSITRIESINTCGFYIRVMNDLLAVLYHPSYNPDHPIEEQLHIWNWKTGQLVSSLGPPEPPSEVRIDTFLFLSSRHFVVSRYILEMDSNFTPCLEVYDFLDSIESGIPRLVKSYQIPELDGTSLMASMFLRSDPAPDNIGSSALPHARPFFLAPSSRLMTVRMEAFDHNHNHKHYMLFVHHSTLLSGLEKDPEQTMVPWDEWGPDSTRFLTSQRRFNNMGWVCYVYGNRYIRTVQKSLRNPREGWYIWIYDFNPLTLQRDKHQYDDSVSNNLHIVEAPTTISAGDSIFAEDVVTRLPYRRIESSTTYPIASAMIEEECIVGLEPSETDAQDTISMLCI